MENTTRREQWRSDKAGAEPGTHSAWESSGKSSESKEKKMDTRTDPKPLQSSAVRNPRSTAAIAGHPLHPMLIPFPIACFVLTLVGDIFFFSMDAISWLMV